MNDAYHKATYERVLIGANSTGPTWEDLTEEQKVAIRKSNDDYQKFMDKLGGRPSAREVRCPIRSRTWNDEQDVPALRRGLQPRAELPSP